jgi:hypothetical protein
MKSETILTRRIHTRLRAKMDSFEPFTMTAERVISEIIPLLNDMKKEGMIEDFYAAISQNKQAMMGYKKSFGDGDWQSFYY